MREGLERVSGSAGREVKRLREVYGIRGEFCDNLSQWPLITTNNYIRGKDH